VTTALPATKQHRRREPSERRVFSRRLAERAQSVAVHRSEPPLASLTNAAASADAEVARGVLHGLAIFSSLYSGPGESAGAAWADAEHHH
jgi:hypothetical protein